MLLSLLFTLIFQQADSYDTKVSRRHTVLSAPAAALLLPNRKAIATTVPPDTVVIPQVSYSPTLSLSSTIQGYWQLAGGHGSYEVDDVLVNMKNHYDVGMTTLDTADIYGPSESIVGQFVKNQPKCTPITKFCCFRFLKEIDRKEVRERVLKSCAALGVEKIPLLQFFWSNYEANNYVDVGLMLSELKEEGLIGEIGATNFDLKRCVREGKWSERASASERSCEH